MRAGTIVRGSLTDRILAVLSESHLPVPTADVIVLTAFGLSHARSRVWSVLRELERAGVVTRTHRRVEHERGTRISMWRLAR